MSGIPQMALIPLTNTVTVCVCVFNSLQRMFYILKLRLSAEISLSLHSFPASNSHSDSKHVSPPSALSVRPYVCLSVRLRRLNVTMN